MAVRKSKKSAARKPKAAAKRPAARKPAKAAASARKVTPGFVSHTEFASSDQMATKAWASKVLGWQFGKEDLKLPDGTLYPMWRHNKTETGGGIRGLNPGEAPSTTPYVETKDLDATFKAAIAAGAVALLTPTSVPDGSRIAIVQAPGGVMVGFWGPK